MESATDSILSNPAALHSLKRDQLVKLCKEHGVKANGKKGELADRLAALNAGHITDNAEIVDPVVGREIIQLGSIREESASDFGSFKSSMSLKSLVSSFGFARSTSQSSSLSSLTPAQPLESQPEEPQPHQIPLPPSPLIEPFTPPPNVDVGSTIRLVNIPHFSTCSTQESTFSQVPSTPPQVPSSSWVTGDTPMLPAFRTSFDLVVEGGVGTPARDVARLLRDGDPGTPTRSNITQGRFEFGTPRASGWAFRPSLSPLPPVPAIPAEFRQQNSDTEMKTASEDDEAPKSRVVPRPSVTMGVMEEMMRRAELAFDPSRPVKPIPRRSLAAGTVASPVKASAADRFDRAHEQMEARMAAINEPKGVLKKRKAVDDVEKEVADKSARVGGRASGARPRASGAGLAPRASGAHRPRTSGVRPRTSGVRPRVSGVRPVPVTAKKGLFGFVKGWFGVKPEPEKKKPVERKLEVKVTKQHEKKLDTVGPSTRKPSLPVVQPATRKVTPTSGIMGPPKFVPKRTSTSTIGSSSTRGGAPTAPKTTARGSVSSTTRGSITSTTRGSINSTTRTNGSVTSTTKGSVSSTTRGSVTSNARGSVTSNTRGSVTSNTRGSVTSTTRGSVSSMTRSSLAPPSSATSKSSLTRASIATCKPTATVPNKFTPTTASSSRLLQPTKSSLARIAPSPTPSSVSIKPEKENSIVVDETDTGTHLATPPRIFRTPLSETTFASMSPSKIPTPGSKLGGGHSSIVSRSTSSRRPRISRTTVVARLAARRQVPSTPQPSGSGSTEAQAPNTVGGVMYTRKSAVGASGRRSIVVDRKVRSSVGGSGVGKAAILGRRSVGGPVRKR